MFLPCPDNLLVNLQESKELVTDLLSKLPEMFATNTETGSALGAALQAAYKLMVRNIIISNKTIKVPKGRLSGASFYEYL